MNSTPSVASSPCPACSATPLAQSPCFVCGRAPGAAAPERARQLAAIESLARDVARRPHLPGDLRVALLHHLDIAREWLDPPPEPAPAPAPAQPRPLPAPAAAIAPAEPIEPPAPPRPVLPDWLRRLGPAAAENLLYLLGGFLFVAGAVYFASTAWTTMSGVGRLLLLDGGLLALAALLIGTGRLLTRGFAAEPAGRRIRRITAHLGAGLAPLAAVIAGRAALADPLVGAAALALVLTAGLGARRLADGALRPAAQLPALAVALAAAVVPLTTAWPLPSALLAGLVVALAAHRLPRDAVGADLIHLGAATAALALHAVLDAGHIAAGSVTLAALAFGLGARVHRREAHLAVLALALVAVGPAFTAPALLPIVALLATAAAARVALRLDSAPLLPVALLGSLIAYVTTPGPLRGLFTEIKALFMAQMGYVHQPMPLAWYGLTCLPYLVAIAWIARRLDDRPAMARLAHRWSQLIAAGLLVIGCLSSDLRAPTAVFGAAGLTFAGIGLWLRRPRFTALAAPALIGSAIAAALWLHLSPARALLLAEGAVALLLAALLPLARRRDQATPLLWSALAPLVIGGLALAFAPPDPALLLALPPLLAVAAARARHADLAASVAAATLALGLIPPLLALLGLDPSLRAPLGAAALLIAAEAHRALRPRPRRRTPAPPIALPLGLTLAFGGWLIAHADGLVGPATLALVGALWLHAALRLHARRAIPVAVLALAAAAGWTLTRASLPDSWIPLGPALVGLAAVALARVDRPRLRRHRALLTATGGGAAIVAAVVAVGLALDAAPPHPAIASVLVALLAAALAPRTPATRALHAAALLAPGAAAGLLAADAPHDGLDVLALIAAPLAYAALDAARRAGRPLLPLADRAAAGFTLATALGAGGALLIYGLLREAPAPALQCLGLLLLTGLARHAAMRHPRTGTAAVLLLTAALVWGPLTLALWPLPTALRPTLYALTALAAALLAAPLGLHRGTARRGAAIIAGLVLAGLVPWIGAGFVPGLDASPPFGLTGAPLAACLLSWGALLIALAPARHRALTALLAAVPLAIGWPVLSAAWAHPAPAIELALLAALAARRTPAAGFALAALALVATGGEPRSTLFAATLTPLLALPLLTARPLGRAIEATLYAAFLAATAWLIALVPSSGRSPLEILPPIAAIAAALLTAVAALAPRLDRLPADLAADLRPRLPRAMLALGGLALGLIGANVATRLGTLAPPPVIATALLAAGLTLAVAIAHARRTGHRLAVDCALLAVAAAHLFLATRTALLTPLDGLHALLWAAAAPALRFIGGVTDLTVRLRHRALLLPIPALIITLPHHADAAVACLLAATTWGLAARQTGRPAFTGLGLALLLAAAARMLLAMHVVDPAFYGLPAGLALVVGAWIERDHLGRRAAEVLQLTGVILADLSIAVQVVRLDAPTHALALFALGLATVAIGWRRRRGDLMIAGAVAVVVDVTLHLLRTGFARGFLAAALLIGAGAVVLLVAGHHTRRRASHS